MLKPTTKQEQFHQENAGWLRTLDFMEQENAFMKQRLGRLLQGFSDPDTLEWAEACQTQMLMKDEAIHLLKQDIHAQETRLASQYLFHDHTLKNELLSFQQQLQQQMEYVENDFFIMKTKFNQYLSAKVIAL